MEQNEEDDDIIDGDDLIGERKNISAQIRQALSNTDPDQDYSLLESEI